MRIKAISSKEQARDWPERLAITDPKAVELLTNLRAVPFLGPFLRGEQTLSAAAACAQRPVSSLAYWLKQFVRAGLVVETGRIARNGMAMPCYRAAARNLVVPIASMPVDRRASMLDEGRLRLLRRFLDGLDEAMVADGLGGLRYYATSSPTGVAVEVDDGEGEAGSHRWTDSWGLLRLSSDHARDLVRELEDIANRYAAMTDAGGRRFVVHLGVAPDPRHRWRSADDR
ncbi:MAG TPA: hypothetical protein VF855_06335 [Acidimicrobiales bacterium]